MIWEVVNTISREDQTWIYTLKHLNNLFNEKYNLLTVGQFY